MRRLITCLLFVTLSLCVQAAEKTEKLLFIGNSFTFFNGGIDHHASQLARYARQSSNPLAFRNAFGGETLQGHIQRRNTPDIINMLPWNHVIIQGYSNEPLTDYKRFENAAKTLSEMAANQGAQSHLLITWAYRNRPAMTEKLQDAYLKAARHLGNGAIPAGPAFALALERRPSLNLYSDNKHPNLAGTYLAACVVYQWLFDKPATQSQYTAGLPAELATFLQTVAQDTVIAFRDK